MSLRLEVQELAAELAEALTRERAATARLTEAEALLREAQSSVAFEDDWSPEGPSDLYKRIDAFLAGGASLRVDDLPDPDYDVTCARCGKVLSCRDAYIEEGDEWECPECWKRCEADQWANR